jgi:hypothetical protein
VTINFPSKAKVLNVFKDCSPRVRLAALVVCVLGEVALMAFAYALYHR